MTKRLSGIACLVAVFLTTTAFAQSPAAGPVTGGASVYGDWRMDSPGLLHKIIPADLPAPLATPVAANRSEVVPKPADASLKTMPGFSVEPFATGLRGARVIRIAPNGDIFVAQSRPEGKITVMRAKDGATKPDSVQVFADGLKEPYGIAFYPPGPNPKWVYVAQDEQVVRFPYKNGDLKASAESEVVVGDLPFGGAHWTRDVGFSPDGKTMYVAVGSATNIAEDMPKKPDVGIANWVKSHAFGSTWGREEWRADVLAFDPEGKNRHVYASGIRNCSGLTVQPGTGALFCATNERDLLGDNLPPDYVTHVQQGAFYGWPWFYIGSHEDPRRAAERPDLKGKVTTPDVLLQPHSAPLGVTFDESSQFPADWKGGAFVALHGSWNRSLHTGYKIVRLPFKDGKPTGEYQDFVTGFTAGDQGVWGRPVDVQFAHDGSLLFSDDGNGVIYRVSYKKP